MKATSRKRPAKSISKSARSISKKAAVRSSDEIPPAAKAPPVVGIGASAGGLEAFPELLRALPTNIGMAFILVQHLEPQHENVLTALLARATKMPVAEVREGMHVEPNHPVILGMNFSSREELREYGFDSIRLFGNQQEIPEDPPSYLF